MYTGQALNTDISKGIFDRFRSLPIWRPAVLVGMLLADAVRYTLASIVVIALGVALGFRPDGGPIGVVLAVALLLVFSFSLSWVWTALGLKLPTPEAVLQISMTVLFPLTFASNVFVDPSTMPGWVQSFVKVNPISHLSTAARGLMHGTAVRRRDRLGAAVERRPGRRLRAPHHAALQRRAVALGTLATDERRRQPAGPRASVAVLAGADAVDPLEGGAEGERAAVADLTGDGADGGVGLAAAGRRRAPGATR